MFYPLLCQLIESSETAVLYGLETIRGGMDRINQIALNFKTYIMLDWSAFDQRVPFAILETFYLKFIPKLLIVNKYYQPIHNYDDDVNHHKFMTDAQNFHNRGLYTNFSLQELSTLLYANRINNVLRFIWTWYKNKVFVTRDGFGFCRGYSGIPSGFLLTQTTGSYANLFSFIYCQLVFGFTSTEIRETAVSYLEMIMLPSQILTLSNFLSSSKHCHIWLSLSLEWLSIPINH